MTPADSSRKHSSTPQRAEGEDSFVAKKAALLPRLGRYRIVCELSSGGMAQVYLAVADGLEKLVALKVVHPHLAREEHFVHMFLDEARIASGIRHRNVCGVFDYGEEDGLYYMAMDFLAGRTLREVMRRLRGKRPGMTAHDVVSFVVSIVADAADGLHAAHELKDPMGASLGVVHRDVSPHNIFVGFDGHAAVIDFGIAHAAGRLQTTATGVLKGKFSYMAPEQIRERQVDRRVDVWALGVCLWEALTQRRLFARDSQADTLMSVMSDSIRPPSEQWPELPKELDAIVLKALARDRDARYATAREFARDLRGYLRNRAGVLSADDMEQRMLSLFPAEALESEQLVRRARSGSLTGLQPVSAEVVLAQRKGTHSGTRLRPVVLPDLAAEIADELSVVFTPATHSATPSLPLRAPNVPVAMPAFSPSEGALGSAHPISPSALHTSTRQRWYAGSVIALGGLSLAAALFWPRTTPDAHAAPITAPVVEAVTPSQIHLPAPRAARPSAPSHADAKLPQAPENAAAAPPSNASANPPSTRPHPYARTGRYWYFAAKRAAAARAQRPERDDEQTDDDSPADGTSPAHQAAPYEASLPATPAQTAPAAELDAPSIRSESPRVLGPTAAEARSAAAVHHTYIASLTIAQVRGALGSSSILRTLTRGTSAIEQCANMRAADVDALGPLQVQVNIDEMGHISRATAAKHPVSGLGACAQGALSKLRSDQKPDVGTVNVDVQISFRAR